MKKILKLDCFIAKVWTSMHIKCISPQYLRIHFLSCAKTKICDVLKATPNAADKGKFYTICRTPEISERNFCDGLEMKFAPPLGGMQQVGATETVAKSAIFCFYFRLVVRSSQIQVSILSSLTSTRSLNLRQRSVMIWIFHHSSYTQHFINHGQLVNHTALIRFD